MICINCKSKENKQIINFGKIPISNDFLNKKQLSNQKKFSLGIFFCQKCYLVQNIKKINNKDIFNEKYSYFSSYSKSWLSHSKKLFNFCKKKFRLNKKSLVVEIASNDGYLLNFFIKKKIPVIGIEPSKSVAYQSRKKGIKTIVDFFSSSLIKKINNKVKPDLILGLNVMAHTPNVGDFVKSLDNLMTEKSSCILEFPYVVNLIRKVQIDTIYHEHYSYLSILSLKNILRKTNLDIYDYKKIETHGGSLRVFIKKKNKIKKSEKNKVNKILLYEKKIGLDKFSFYKNYSKRVMNILNHNKKSILKISKKNKIIGYGAAAKSTIITNILKINYTIVKFIVDNNPFKQNKFIPGTNIPIKNFNSLKINDIDYIIIFPWNIKNEIMSIIRNKTKFEGKFITFSPKIKIIN